MVQAPGLGAVATLPAANQLIVEHRFFMPSRPEPADGSTLTIEQAAADLHRITAAFKNAAYPARWISTGASKGSRRPPAHMRQAPALTRRG